MKKLFFVSFFLLLMFPAISQGIKLKNVIVVGQFDKPEDRFSVEINLTEMLSSQGVKALPSLNILKQGADQSLLASDTIAQLVLLKGFDTYLVVNVKGYDRKFKKSLILPVLSEALNRVSLYHIFKDEVTSVTFEFTFYRSNQPIYTEILKCGNVSNREDVVKKLRKKMPKLIEKWKQ